MKTSTFVLLAAVFLCGGSASAQVAQEDSEPVAIIELGGAAAWSVKNAASSFGPAAAVEFTPIENWMEIEAGVTPLFARHSTEWDTDVLLKKPWTLSHTVEFMAGIGPEWVHTNSRGTVTNAVAAEAALDFMFWPSGKHRFGWYLEPSYDYSFGRGHEQSVGVTAGFLIAIR